MPTFPHWKGRVQVITKGYQTYGQIHEVDEENETITIKLNPPQAQYTAH